MTSGRNLLLPVKRWTLLLGLSLVSAPSVFDQESFPAWVGLHDPAHNGWLENENRIGELCGDPATLPDCYLKHLAPLISVYPLHSRPDSSSRRMGDLVVAAVPGRGLSSYFRAAGERQAIPFTPDLFLQDWGYGIYFHQTFAEQTGNWFKLPFGPWAEEVWVQREWESENSTLILLQAGNILEMNGSSWFVVAAERDALILRPEQPADFWCEEGDPPPVTPVEKTRFTRQELLDPDGHLVFRLKYLKGC
jgi:hypothetical protein